jgi:hypothetical protein
MFALETIAEKSALKGAAPRLNTYASAKGFDEIVDQAMQREVK